MHLCLLLFLSNLIRSAGESVVGCNSERVLSTGWTGVNVFYWLKLESKACDCKCVCWHKFIITLFAALTLIAKSKSYTNSGEKEEERKSAARTSKRTNKSTNHLNVFTRRLFTLSLYSIHSLCVNKNRSIFWIRIRHISSERTMKWRWKKNPTHDSMAARGLL